MSLLRELSRRKLRTTLTIVGITIGIWALVVFSSMANKINGLVGMGTEFYADKIVVTDGEAFGTSPMRLADAEAIAGLDGVAAVDPQIQFLWDPDPAVGFGVPDLLTGLIPGAGAGQETFKLELATGRMLTAEDADPVLQLDGEHGVRQWFDDRAFDLDRISFRHGRCWVPFSHGMPARGADTRKRSISDTGDSWQPPGRFTPTARGRIERRTQSSPC